MRVGASHAWPLLQALDVLPAQQRAAVILRYYHDYDYATIAQILNTTLDECWRDALSLPRSPQGRPGVGTGRRSSNGTLSHERPSNSNAS